MNICTPTRKGEEIEEGRIHGEGTGMSAEQQLKARGEKAIFRAATDGRIDIRNKLNICLFIFLFCVSTVACYVSEPISIKKIILILPMRKTR